MADYNTITKISQIDVATPAGGESASKLDDAIRQIKQFLATFLAVAHDDTGNLKADATTVLSIPNDSIVYSKIQNVSATDKLLGRSTAGAGDIEEIACTAAGRAVLDDADAAAQRTTLGLGAMATKATVATADIDGGAITTAKLAASAVTANELAANAVTGTKIINGAVDPTKISNIGDAKVLAGDGTNAAALTVGGALTATRSGSTLLFALAGGGGTSGIAALYATIEEKTSSGTNAGGSTGGSYVARTLVETFDSGDIVGTSGANITIKKKGTYLIRGFATAYSVGLHRCKLRQTSGTPTDLLLGTSSSAPPGVTTMSSFCGILTIADDNTTVQLQHWTENTVASNGFGIATAAGEAEMYACVEFFKV